MLPVKEPDAVASGLAVAWAVAVCSSGVGVAELLSEGVKLPEGVNVVDTVGVAVLKATVPEGVAVELLLKLGLAWGVRVALPLPLRLGVGEEERVRSPVREREGVPETVPLGEGLPDSVGVAVALLLKLELERGVRDALLLPLQLGVGEEDRVRSPVREREGVAEIVRLRKGLPDALREVFGESEKEVDSEDLL